MDVQQRIYDILSQKAAMGGACYCDPMGMGVPYIPRQSAMPMSDGMGGVEIGGVLLGGARKRKPTAFNKKVVKIMKEYGVTLGEASKIASGMHKKKTVKRKKKRGGAIDIESLVYDDPYEFKKAVKDYKNQFNMNDYCSEALKAENLKALAKSGDLKKIAAIRRSCKPTQKGMKKAVETAIRNLIKDDASITAFKKKA